MTAFDELQWDERGLLPAIVQAVATQQVLMLAWMNEEALRLTLQTGEVHFWSRSRQELWHKGAESGNTMVVSDVSYDCDGDTILVRAWPQGPACHTGNSSCFYRAITIDDLAPAGRRTLGAKGYQWAAEAAEGA
jgi:phosphoribosyl-ATP pyrophosphohydrolase/phosphoribosyl-AMP cyclohydrolase